MSPMQFNRPIFQTLIRHPARGFLLSILMLFFLNIFLNVFLDFPRFNAIIFIFIFYLSLLPCFYLLKKSLAKKKWNDIFISIFTLILIINFLGFFSAKNYYIDSLSAKLYLIYKNDEITLLNEDNYIKYINESKEDYAIGFNDNNFLIKKLSDHNWISNNSNKIFAECGYSSKKINQKYLLLHFNC